MILIFFTMELIVTSAMAMEDDEPGDLIQLKPVTVYGKSLDGEQDSFVKSMDPKKTSNKDTYSANGIDLFGRQGNTNVFKVADMAPSVNYTPVDNLGTNESGFHDAVRIRGKKQTGPANIKNYEGIPISGNPGGGKTMFDLENIESVDVYKGYIPVDKGLGLSNLAGKVDMAVKRPDRQFGANLSQSVGGDRFSRTFIRIDSGEMNGFSSFASFSYTTGDKFKGEGDLERTNGSIGLLFRPTDKMKMECFISHNDDTHHNYYNLSYAETRDMGAFYRKDFGTDPSRADYYDYNTQDFKDTAVIANWEAILPWNSTISVKPYFLDDQGTYAYTSKNSVVCWDIDHQLYGAVLTYKKQVMTALDVKLGYWIHKQESPGPPTDQKTYTVGPGGLTFAGYAVLADNDPHIIHSPFVEASGEVGSVSYRGGVRYVDLELGALKSYTNGTNPTTSQKYDTAISQGTPDSWASVDADHFREFLPSIYVGYALGDDALIYADYTRTYGLDVNLFPTYVRQRGNFVSRGITLQSLWDDMALEKSDNIDLGVKLRIGKVHLNPNLFLSLVKNKQARVYDPDLGVTYPFNGSDAMAYGMEMTATGAMTDSLDFFLSVSYDKFYFIDDLQTASNTTVASEGNQVPDAPEYMVKGALSYGIDGCVFTPSFRYLSKRYGDVLNTEKVSGCTLVDLDMSYTFARVPLAESIVFRLTAINVFNERYVAAINTADDALAATQTAATYQTGAPFSLFAGVEFSF